MTRYRPSYATARNEIVPVMVPDTQGQYVAYTEHKIITDQQAETIKQLQDRASLLETHLADAMEKLAILDIDDTAAVIRQVLNEAPRKQADEG